jgi:hypothetical protein
MNQLIRTFCLMLAVAIMASMMLHGPSEARDQAEHLADEIAEQHGVEVRGHSHPDCSESAGETAPGHHHHNGGDTHSFAVPDKAGLILAIAGARSSPQWPQDMMPNGLSGSGLDQPPKRMRTII